MLSGDVADTNLVILQEHSHFDHVMGTFPFIPEGGKQLLEQAIGCTNCSDETDSACGLEDKPDKTHPGLAYSLFLINLVLSSFILHRYCSSPDSNLYHFFFFTIGYFRLLFQWLFFFFIIFSSVHATCRQIIQIFESQIILHMVKMIKKIAVLLVYYTCACMCICVCMHVCVCSYICTVYMVPDTLIFPKYPLQNIFFIFSSSFIEYKPNNRGIIRQHFFKHFKNN